MSRGHICPKAVALQDLHEDPERLRKPVRNVSKYSEALFDAGPGIRHDWQILLERAHPYRMVSR